MAGVGPTSVVKIRQATEKIVELTKEEINPRLNPDNLTKEATDVIRSVASSIHINESYNKYSNSLDNIRPDLLDNINRAQRRKGRIKWLFTSKKNKEIVIAAENNLEEILKGEHVRKLEEIYNQIEVTSKKHLDAKDAFQKDSVSFYTKIEELTDYGKIDEQKYMSSELVYSIESYEINLDNFDAQLRGYQEFGAKYILHQKKTLLGDEMGLGKTIQALASINHLYQLNQKKAIVICPLSVISNWERETEKFTSIPVFIYHGANKENAYSEWNKHGGILLTNYASAKKIEYSEDFTLDICIVDEAHYVKNPSAQRSKAVYQLADLSSYVVFMSGTPLENKVSEMRQLISVLQPDIANAIGSGIHSLQPQLFRKTIAPVYLRRNREEVLAELPELDIIERWVDFGSNERQVYKDYLEQNNIMGMRRSAWMGNTFKESPKLKTLIDICNESKENGYKVLVFSFFRDVIRTVHHSIENSLEPITGDIPNNMRQEIIDEFTSSETGSVLISQITAGGVGLNIQAANVVILCEPQWKPSTEQQAISRVYRMGQTRNVIVYRLLTKESIDESMIKLLGSKTQLFEDYAKESEIADQSSLAKDISDSNLKEKLLSMERERYSLPQPAMPSSTASVTS